MQELPGLTNFIGELIRLDDAPADVKDFAWTLQAHLQRINPDVDVVFVRTLLARAEGLQGALAADLARRGVIPPLNMRDGQPWFRADGACGRSRGTVYGTRVAVAIGDDDVAPADTTTAVLTAFHEVFHSVYELLTPLERQRLESLVPEPAELPGYERVAEAYAVWSLAIAMERDTSLVAATDRRSWLADLILKSDEGWLSSAAGAGFAAVDETFDVLAAQMRLANPCGPEYVSGLLPAHVALDVVRTMIEEPVFRMAYNGSLFRLRAEGAVDYHASNAPAPPEIMPTGGLQGATAHLAIVRDALVDGRVLYCSTPPDPEFFIEQLPDGAWYLFDGEDGGDWRGPHATAHTAWEDHLVTMERRLRAEEAVSTPMQAG